MDDLCSTCVNMLCPIKKGDSIPWQHPATCSAFKPRPEVEKP